MCTLWDVSRVPRLMSDDAITQAMAWWARGRSARCAQAASGVMATRPAGTVKRTPLPHGRGQGPIPWLRATLDRNGEPTVLKVIP